MIPEECILVAYSLKDGITMNGRNFSCGGSNCAVVSIFHTGDSERPFHCDASSNGGLFVAFYKVVSPISFFIPS